MKRWLALGALAIAVLVVVFLVATNSGNERQDVADTAKTNSREIIHLKRQVLPIQRVLIRKDILRPGQRGLTGGRGPFGPIGAAGATGATGVGETGAQGLLGATGADSSVPGPPGRDGADSTVPGPKGDPGEDSTVPGPPGQQGPPGQDGSTPDLNGYTFSCPNPLLFTDCVLSPP